MSQYPIELISTQKNPIETININTKTSRRMRSSDGEFVRYVEDKHDRWLDFHSGSRKRLYEVLDAFMDINGGMWPEVERKELEAADRHAISINIAKQKMETLSGSLMSERGMARFPTRGGWPSGISSRLRISASGTWT